MATLNDSLVSSSARKLHLRTRPDLVVERHRYQGRISWVVKDPVGLKYYRFQEGEYFILGLLNGHTSLDEIKEQFEAEFPPEKISVEELQHFIGSLHRSGLILADVTGQGVQLKKRRDERRWKEFLAAASNILSIRFKGIDPDRFLNWLYPYVRWLYSPWVVAACMILAISAALLVAVQFDVFQSKLPDFHQFFNVKNAFWLAIALAVTKIIHEFGHGMTCKHYGGECHEIGVLILVLTPCLYCNVSDSWMLPNKWQRAMIGAGGMYVELVIASICTFIWWFSVPGLLNHLALSTMFVCSVSTVIFNGNPLLRYDGYYILSDIMEIPNLRQKSTDILNRKMAHLCLGIEPQHDPFLPERNQIFFALYTVAAALYRWIVVFSILWFLYQVFKPYRLEVIGQIITLMGVYGLFFQPIYKVFKFFWVPGRVDKVKKPRMYATLAVLAAVALAFVLVPLPYYVHCPIEIKPRHQEMVYVEVPGVLQEIKVQPGDVVQKDQVLARLNSSDLDMKIAELTGRRNQYVEQLKNLDQQRVHVEKAEDRKKVSDDISHTVALRKTAEEQLAQQQADLQRLSLVAQRPGTILPPPEVAKRKMTDGQLSGWTGTPMKHENLGAFLPESTLFCEIGDPRQMEAHLVIDQADVEFVHDNQPVKILLDGMTYFVWKGKIESVAKTDIKVSSKQLSNKSGGELATVTDESGVERPMNTSYAACVPLDDPEGLLRIGLKGRAKVEVGSRTLAQRFWRYLTQTFHFRL